MKNCPKCGASCEDAFAFCPYCTTPLAAPAQAVPAPAPKKSHKKVIFLTTAIVAIVAIAAVCVWAFFLRDTVHNSPENVVKAYLTACMKDKADKYEDCLLEVEGDPGMLNTNFGFLSGSKIESFEIKSSSEPDEDQLWDIESSLDAAGFYPDGFEEFSNVKVKVKLDKESFNETYVCCKMDEKWYVLWPWQFTDEPNFSNLQLTDRANARALKSLVVANYMAADDEESPSVRSILSKLGDDETATFYLSTDGRSIVYSPNDDCCKVSSELWGGLEKGEPISVTANNECLIVDSIPYLPKLSE